MHETLATSEGNRRNRERGNGISIRRDDNSVFAICIGYLLALTFVRIRDGGYGGAWIISIATGTDAEVVVVNNCPCTKCKAAAASLTRRATSVVAVAPLTFTARRHETARVIASTGNITWCSRCLLYDRGRELSKVPRQRSSARFIAITATADCLQMRMLLTLCGQYNHWNLFVPK